MFFAGTGAAESERFDRSVAHGHGVTTLSDHTPRLLALVLRLISLFLPYNVKVYTQGPKYSEPLPSALFRVIVFGRQGVVPC